MNREEYTEAINALLWNDAAPSAYLGALEDSRINRFNSSHCLSTTTLSSVAYYPQVTDATGGALYLVPRTKQERRKHFESILLRYYDKQQRWLKKVEPYVQRTKYVTGYGYRVTFLTAEMRTTWEWDAVDNGILLDTPINPEVLRLISLLKGTVLLKRYIASEWERV